MSASVDLKARLFKDVPDYPEQNHNPYIRLWDEAKQETYYEHRRVAEQKLGRKLKPGEVVHHRDSDKQNNGFSNIVIFSSQRAHMLFEHYIYREANGIQHMFSIDELLQLNGEWVLE